MMQNFRRKDIAAWFVSMVLASLIAGEITCQCHGFAQANESASSESTFDRDSSCSSEHHDHHDADDSNYPRDCDCSAVCCDTFVFSRANDDISAADPFHLDLCFWSPGFVHRPTLTLTPHPSGSTRFLSFRKPPIPDLYLQTQALLI